MLMSMTTKRAYIRRGNVGWHVHLRTYPYGKVAPIIHWEVFWYPTWEMAVAGLPSIWRR